MNIISVGTGILLFLCALTLLWRTYRIAAVNSLRPYWAALAAFIVFFLIGYGVFLATLIRGAELTGLSTLIAQIFLWGSVFVLLCSWLFLSTVRQRLQIEQDLRKANEQVERAQRMEAMGLVAGGIAHDFNNFLTAIIGLAEIGADSSENSNDTRDDFAQIQQTGQRASALTRQLLAFSGGQVLSPIATPIAQVLKQQASLLKSLLGENIDLQIIARTDKSAMIDTVQFERVIMNLTINAKDAMPDGGSLRIEVRESTTTDDQQLLITITDTGKGIPTDHYAKIFDPFFTTSQSNHGLGLATAHGIIQQHSGSLEVDSTHIGGARFFIRLPQIASNIEQSNQKVPKADQTQGSDHKIFDVLVVDDDASIRDLIVRHLESAGYRAIQASSYSEAVNQAKRIKDTLGLVITDIVMPGNSGVELSQWFKDWAPGLPVLFITGYSKNSEKLSHLPPGSAVIHKPFMRDTLLKRVEDIFANHNKCS